MTPIKSIPTIYNNIQMKSRLEAEIAFCLDKLNIRWLYEPKSFLLLSGKHYWPDFYCPDIKQWIEGKGIATEEVFNISEEFSKLTKNELIVMSQDWIVMYVCEKDQIYSTSEIGICRGDCGKKYFNDYYMSYHCRACDESVQGHFLKNYNEPIYSFLDLKQFIAVNQILDCER